MLGFAKKLFDPNKRELKRLQSITDQVNALKPEIKKLSDKQLASKTEEFKKKLVKGVQPKDLLPEAFAVVREVAHRVLGQGEMVKDKQTGEMIPFMEPFDVQVMAGIALWEGKIAEQKTGEGKTLTAVLPLYLRALEGKGAHLVTVNDYLARRDCGWMGQIFDFLGLSVGCIIPQESFVYDREHQAKVDDERLAHLKPAERKEAYAADITYGTSNEFGFDYLRDNIAQKYEDVVQPNHYFAIVDEVDFALIDEARTPLIISSPQAEATDKYYRFAKLAGELFVETDYVVDEKAKTAMLTEYGIRKVEKMLGSKNLYEEDFDTIHQIENALKARTLFHRDKDYVVKEGQVIIVDEFTGRLMHGRRWSDGLHQSVEAKEGVDIQRESKTWATITFQNFFRMYDVLSGMTATAETEREEFRQIYNLDVIVVPTNRPVARKDHPDVIYKTRRSKYAAVVNEINEAHEKGQPVLVGTTSIENNEMLGNFLKKKKIPHQILNAKHHQKEARIIAQAGSVGAVTVATNMAGRGIDIVLGGEKPDQDEKDYEKKLGEWKKEHQKVLDLGGLYVVGTERHEARRIDNQLRGRAGRQGDPGASRFFVSLEDDLMRIFGGERIGNLMSRLNMPEDMPISHSMVSRLIEQIQVKVEGFNYDIRKSLVEFDDIVNKQREIIYGRRQEILSEHQENPEKLKDRVVELVKRDLEIVYNASLDPVEMKPEMEKLIIGLTEIIPLDNQDERKKLAKKIKGDSREKVLQKMAKEFLRFYEEREKRVGKEISREIDKSILLYTIDHLWVDHLTALDSLKEGVRLRGYGQRDPLVEYRKESYQMFQDLLGKIDYHVARRVLRVEVANQPKQEGRISEGRGKLSLPSQGSSGEVSREGNDVFSDNQEERQKVEKVVSNQEKVGRNDPCPCGSGKKYKKCCYPKFG